MARKRYAWASMIYGCSDCNKGCTMLLEEGIEGGFEPHKPAPFFIQCPFCGGHSFHHVNMHAEVFKSRRRIGPTEPFFANIKGDGCGCPMHMELAHVQYTISQRPSNVSEKPLAQLAEHTLLNKILATPDADEFTVSCPDGMKITVNAKAIRDMFKITPPEHQ